MITTSSVQLVATSDYSRLKLESRNVTQRKRRYYVTLMALKLASFVFRFLAANQRQTRSTSVDVFFRHDRFPVCYTDNVYRSRRICARLPSTATIQRPGEPCCHSNESWVGSRRRGAGSVRADWLVGAGKNGAAYRCATYGIVNQLALLIGRQNKPVYVGWLG